MDLFVDSQTIPGKYQKTPLTGQAEGQKQEEDLAFSFLFFPLSSYYYL